MRTTIRTTALAFTAAVALASIAAPSFAQTSERYIRTAPPAAYSGDGSSAYSRRPSDFRRGYESYGFAVPGYLGSPTCWQDDGYGHFVSCDRGG